MKLVEILDSAGIKSAHIEAWIETSMGYINSEFVLKYDNCSVAFLEKECLKIMPFVPFSEDLPSMVQRLSKYNLIDLTN